MGLPSNPLPAPPGAPVMAVVFTGVEPAGCWFVVPAAADAAAAATRFESNLSERRLSRCKLSYS